MKADLPQSLPVEKSRVLMVVSVRAPVEDQLHHVPAAEIEILADDLLKQHAPAQGTVQDLRQPELGL